MRRKIIFANPTSGNTTPEQKRTMLDHFAFLLKVNGDTYQPPTLCGLDTKTQQEFQELARTEIRNGDDVYVAGGDGTFRDICAAAQGKDAIIAPVPLGTGCAIRSEFQIPYLSERNAHKLVRRLIDAPVRDLDLIAIDHTLTPWASIGIEGDICDRYARSTIKGRLGYLACSAAAMREQEPANFTLILDGAKQEVRAKSLMATKFKFYGKGLQVMPAATHDDGAMYISARQYGILSTPIEFAAAQLHFLRPRYDTARELIVKSDRDMKLQSAGDYVSEGKEFSLRVVPNAVKIRW